MRWSTWGSWRMVARSSGWPISTRVRKFCRSEAMFVSLVLIGQPELRATIRQLPQVDQRISLRYHLNALSHDETRRYLERQLARQALGHREDLVREVRKTIRLLMTTGQCNVESAADHLGMHSRTLHRHLRRQDTTFTELLEETRRALASELMRDSHLDIQRISQILGYSDATAFSRAFKRWHGMPPAGWRAAH